MLDEWDNLWYGVLIVRYDEVEGRICVNDGLGFAWWRNIKRIRERLEWEWAEG